MELNVYNANQVTFADLKKKKKLAIQLFVAPCKIYCCAYIWKRIQKPFASLRQTHLSQGITALVLKGVKTGFHKQSCMLRQKEYLHSHKKVKTEQLNLNGMNNSRQIQLYTAESFRCGSSPGFKANSSSACAEQGKYF